jgi:multidrug efflux pump subunit AcrA (membrane-fusion protein)
MNKKVIWGSSIFILIIVSYNLFFSSDDQSQSEIVISPKRGEFQIDITTSGELEAKTSVKVMGPNGLRAARMWQVKIDNIVDEGTVVDKGEYIAQLDRSDLMEKIQTSFNDLQQSLSKFTQTKLDTALDLRQARNELINLKYGVEEKEIILSQSKFEPPATIKQSEINLDKAKREHNQASENYKLKSAKAKAQMQEAQAILNDNQSKSDFLNKLREKFTIIAPESGMVIYKTTWDGTKQGTGSMLQTWNPVVATLPDLSKMISKTYINEVDVRLVKKNQVVQIGLDAFPKKKLTGKIISVANVGEQKPNSDAKVFQVRIEINESDTTLRPSMTTSNKIIAEVVADALSVPLECLHSQGDSIVYVIKKDGFSITKQEVRVGKSNENEIVIIEGVSIDDKLLLSIPLNKEADNIRLLENISISQKN